MSSAPQRVMYELRLYTTGATPRSIRAVRNLVTFCSKNLPGHYRLRVVDLYEEPAQAALVRVVAAPTLLKVGPTPVRRVIGDLSDEAMMRRTLGLPEAES